MGLREENASVMAPPGDDFRRPRFRHGGISKLSRLDERFGFLDGCQYLSADNATFLIRLADGTSREFLDLMSAFGSVNFGHANPDILGRIHGKHDVTGLCYPPEAESLAGWLCDNVAPGEEARVLFQVGGSFAVSAALALCLRARPGRIATVRGAFHGLGVDTISITSVQRAFALHDTLLTSRVSENVTIVDPGEVPDFDGVSCFIYEPVQGANGYVPLDPAWLHSVEALARSAGAIVIADEIQAGFFRHGSLSPSRALGLSPDIRLYSKSLTNGTYPLSAVVYPAWLEPLARQPFLAHTFQTASYGYVAGAAVADWLGVTAVEALCARVTDLLRDCASGLPPGAARDVHVTGPTLSFEPTRPAREIVRDAFAHGLLLAAGGASFQRIRVAPPLTIDPSDLERGLRALMEVVTDAAKQAEAASARASARSEGTQIVDRPSFYARMRDYLVEEAGRSGCAVPPASIGEHDNLFDSGLVNSFSLVKLLIQVEEMLGVQVDVTRHDPETFFSLAGMYDNLRGLARGAAQ
jgi:4-aminobutyrate aminotransferase-like enzyme